MTNSSTQRSAINRWGSFVVAACLLAFIWLVVLPTLAKWPTIDAHIQRMQRERIDPSAMFYTELDESWQVGAAEQRGKRE